MIVQTIKLTTKRTPDIRPRDARSQKDEKHQKHPDHQTDLRCKKQLFRDVHNIL